MPAGKKARLVLKKEGELQYFCEYHPNMTGKIVVMKARGSDLFSTETAVLGTGLVWAVALWRPVPLGAVLWKRDLTP